MSTSKNVDIQLHITNWKFYYSSTVVLSTTGSCLHKKHRSVEYNRFVQSTVDAKTRCDEILKSRVLAENNEASN